MLTFGIAVAGLSFVAPDHDRETGKPLLRLAGTIVVVAGACVVAHVVTPLIALGINPATGTPDHTLSFPWEPVFWHYLFGLFDRAVLSTSVSTLSFWRGMGVAMAIVLPLLLLPRFLWLHKLEPEERARVREVAIDPAFLDGHSSPSRICEDLIGWFTKRRRTSESKETTREMDRSEQALELLVTEKQRQLEARRAALTRGLRSQSRGLAYEAGCRASRELDLALGAPAN